MIKISSIENKYLMLAKLVKDLGNPEDKSLEVIASELKNGKCFEIEGTRKKDVIVDNTFMGIEDIESINIPEG